MSYKCFYKTPEGFSDIIMDSDGECLTGLNFVNGECVNFGEESNLDIFKDTIKWLDIYFSGEVPEFVPKYKINNITAFRSEVTDIMNSIKFGDTMLYSDIAKIIAKNRGIGRMSSQAVGGAVGANPICIIVPCHRVVGIDKNLTGYGGGIDNKIALLKHEGHDMSEYILPKNK